MVYEITIKLKLINLSMKLYLKLLSVFICTIWFSSCGQNKAQQFVQPTVLEKNSAFNLAQLNFSENVTQLISKSLDSGDLDVKGLGKEAFKSRDSLGSGEIQDHYVLLGEKRYFFKTRKVDSIARFDSLFFYKAGLETDKDNHLVAIVADAKFRDKKELDKFLSKLFKKLGKTTEELAIKADDQKQIDDQKAKGWTDEELKRMGSQGTQYDLLDYGDDAYFEWKLKDRYIQVSVSKDREIYVSTDPKENSNIEYLYLKFLVIKKDEYEKIEKLQYDCAVKQKFQCRVLMPYTLYSLDPLTNPRYQKKLDKAWGAE